MIFHHQINFKQNNITTIVDLSVSNKLQTKWFITKVYDYEEIGWEIYKGRRWIEGENDGKSALGF